MNDNNQNNTVNDMQIENQNSVENGFQYNYMNGNTAHVSNTVLNTAPAFYRNTLKKMPKKVFEINRKDIVFFVLGAVSLFILSRIGFASGFNLGFSVSYLLLAGCCAAYTYNKSASNKAFYFAVLVCAALIAVSYSINTEVFVKIIDFFSLIFLTLLGINGLSGSVKNDDFSYALLGDLFKHSFITMFENIAVPFSSLKSSFKSGKSKEMFNTVGGVLIALPVLCIIIPVLSESDFAFNSLISSIFKNAGLTIACIAFTVIFTPVLISYIFSLNKGVVRNSEKKTVTPEGKVSSSLLNSFLITVSAAYIVYLFSQLAYISDALSFLLPEEFTAAEFARRGFFEMAVISFINLIIVCVCSVLVKNGANGKKPLFTKILLVFLCCFSLFYIVSALYRMFLYISLFALTKLRVLTTAFMFMLILIFAVVLLSIFIKKLHYMKPVILICAVTLCVISFVDINTLIAEYNYNAYIEKGIELDCKEIYETGEGYDKLLKIYDNKKLTDEQRFFAAEGIVDALIFNYEYTGTTDGYWLDEITASQFKNVVRNENLRKNAVFSYNYIKQMNLDIIDDLIENEPEKILEINRFYSDYMFPEDDTEIIIDENI